MSLIFRYIGEKVPMEVRTSLDAMIKALHLEDADNFRFSPLDDPDGLNEFTTLSLRGTGESFEHEVPDNNGRMWLVGCNHGF